MDVPGPRRRRRMIVAALLVSLAAQAAIVVWFQVRRDVDVLATLRDLDVGLLPVALALHMAAHGVWAARIGLLARGMRLPLRWPAAWALVTAGQFGAAVTPGRFGAEALRVTFLVRAGAGAQGAGKVVLADRASDMLFFVVGGTAAVVLMGAVFGADAMVLRGMAMVAVAGLSAFIVVVATALWRPRVVARAVQAVTAGVWRVVRRPTPDVATPAMEFVGGVRAGVVELARRMPWRVGASMVLSVTLWACEFAVLWVVLQALGVDAAYAVVFAAGIVITMLAAVPISPGGAGVAETAAAVLLTPVAGAHAAAFVLVWRALTYYYDLAVGSVVAAIVARRRALLRPVPT